MTFGWVRWSGWCLLGAALGCAPADVATLDGAATTNDSAAPTDVQASDVSGRADVERVVDGTAPLADGGPQGDATSADDAPAVDATTDATTGTDTGFRDVPLRDVRAADVGVDSGPPISSEGGPCGGFIRNAPVCATGLVCVPSPVPDLPGICRLACGGTTDCPRTYTCVDNACVQRPCTLACVMGRQNCGFDCCVDLQTDTQHCGSCGNTCSGSMICRGGHCMN